MSELEIGIVQIDLRKLESYLSVPGTSEPLLYREDSFTTRSGDLRYLVSRNVIDFIGGISNPKNRNMHQLEYWESSVPGLRPPTHPVQVLFAEQRFKYLERIIQFHNVNTALDVGCGNGAGTISLRNRVATVFGLDMSRCLLSQIPENIFAIRGNASQLPLRDKSVDFSMVWEVLHHIDNPLPVLQEMHRVTRQWIVVFESNRWNPLQAAFSLAVQKDRLGLRNTRTYLTEKARQAGFNITHYATVGCIFPNKSPVFLANMLVKLPFVLPYVGISHLLIAKLQ